MSGSAGSLARALLEIDSDRPIEGGTWSPVPGRALRAKSSRIVARHLSELWRACRPERLGCASALCLAGSFAREEGGPRSDLDVVLLVEDETPGLADVAHDLVTELWSTGLSVDHSIRTPAQCREIAKSDLPALTGLLDLVLVAGDASLHETVVRGVGEDLRRQAPARVGELLEAARARWGVEDLLHQVNEPHLKDCRGGIRDVGLMRVLTAAWLADRPHGALDEALDLLLDVRDALHFVTDRHVAELLRADQRAVAERLGLEGEDSEAELRRLLTGAATEIDAATRRVVDAAERQAPSWGAGALARRVIRAVAPGRGGARRTFAQQMVSESTCVVDGRLSFPATSLASDPAAVLDLGRTSASMGLEPSGTALDAIAAAVWRGDHAIARPWPAPLLRALLDLLSAPSGFVGAWSHLEATGVVDAWIPE